MKRPRRSSTCAGVTSVRKPTRPRFTPTKGTCSGAAIRAARKIVPSPPKVNIRSSPLRLLHGTLVSGEEAWDSITCTPLSASKRPIRSDCSIALGIVSLTMKPTVFDFGFWVSDFGSIITFYVSRFTDCCFDHRLEARCLHVEGRLPLKIGNIFDVARRASDGRASKARDMKVHSAPQPRQPHYNIPVNLGVAHHAAFTYLLAACFKLRLYKEEEKGAGLCQPEGGGRDEFETDVGHVSGNNIYRFGEGIQVANIGLLHDYHPGVLPQLPGQLVRADIHGINALCPVLQQYIGEAAG